MKELADDILIQRLRGDSYSAFNEIHARYWKYLYTIAYRKTGDKDHAFDLCQSVFVDFFEKRGQLDIHIPLKNYLRRAMLYKLLSFFRSKGFQKKHYRNFQHYIEQQDLMVVSDDPLELQESTTAFEDLLDLVYQTVEDMPDRMKAIFKLSREEEKTTQQIADMLDLSQQTVKNQLGKAYNRIRSVAQEHGVGTSGLAFIYWLTNY